MGGGKIAIAMSGGVDSSTAALILKNEGWDPVGFSMQLWDRKREFSAGTGPESGGGCASDEFVDARETAALLNIPYHVIDFRKEFETAVVRPFMEEYSSGLTPSPCVHCNSLMKFEGLIRLAKGIGATHVATGHYARVAIDEDNGRHILMRARDKSKDQAYFLFELNQAKLARAVFPLGDRTKEQVRDMASRYGLQVASKSESQEICFIPDGDYASFIERYYEEIVEKFREKPGGISGAKELFSPGTIVDTEGRILGVHKGIHRFTIGQRRGLGIAHSHPLYVLEIDRGRNRVIVGERSRLGKRRCRAVRPNWISIPDLTESIRVQAKIRSRHPEAPATISPGDNGSVEVLFDTPQPAVSPGQACVFYQGDIVVGGGWIARE